MPHCFSFPRRRINVHDPDQAPATELEHLLALIKTGQLFAVQKWNADRWNHSSAEVFAANGKASPLLYAIESGFHSMVEVLVKAGGWSQPQLNEAYDAAIAKHRSDIVGFCATVARR